MTNPIKAPMKIKVDETGKFGQVPNPYQQSYWVDKETMEGHLNQDWIDFDKANPPHPLTSPQTPNSEIECREVWQKKNFTLTEWSTDAPFETWKSFTDYKSYWYERETRIAFEPLTALVDGVGENTAMDVLKPFIKHSKWINPSEMVYVNDAVKAMEEYAAIKVSNALDEAVRLVNLKKEVWQDQAPMYDLIVDELTDMANQLNTLRK